MRVARNWLKLETARRENGPESRKAQAWRDEMARVTRKARRLCNKPGDTAMAPETPEEVGTHFEEIRQWQSDLEEAYGGIISLERRGLLEVDRLLGGVDRECEGLPEGAEAPPATLDALHATLRIVRYWTQRRDPMFKRRTP